MGEFELIAKIRADAIPNSRVLIGIGDDCASFCTRPDHELLVTTDMLMEGRHFLRGVATLEQVGRKAMGVNLSDIAAMGGVPLAATVAVALPKRDAERIALELHAGVREMAERFEVPLIGGDTNAWDGPLVISVTLLGEVEAGQAIKRSGAKPGDLIFVTGAVGGSLGGRHLDVHPRVREARSLAQTREIHAMIDISDGLAADLSHILEESGGVGALLDLHEIPIHPDAIVMSERDGRTPLDHALNDGEDFELLFIANPESETKLRTALPGIRCIGEVTQQSGILGREANGSTHVIATRGFDHLAK